MLLRQFFVDAVTMSASSSVVAMSVHFTAISVDVLQMQKFGLFETSLKNGNIG